MYMVIIPTISPSRLTISRVIVLFWELSGIFKICVWYDINTSEQKLLFRFSE